MRAADRRSSVEDASPHSHLPAVDKVDDLNVNVPGRVSRVDAAKYEAMKRSSGWYQRRRPDCRRPRWSPESRPSSLLISGRMARRLDGGRRPCNSIWRRGDCLFSTPGPSRCGGTAPQRWSGSERIRSVIKSASVVLSGQTLRDLRLNAGLSQVEVARRVGIVATVLSAYERGRRQPSVEVAGRIIEAMGYDITFIRRLDPEVQACRLVDVLTLAEALPFHPRPLATARW